MTAQNTAPMAAGYKITLSAFQVFPFNGACLTLCGPRRRQITTASLYTHSALLY